MYVTQNNMSTKQELNKFYSKHDPWGYRTNKWDQERRANIIAVLNQYGLFERALDIGCGEGWVTEALPAKELYGYDISDIALSRLPKSVSPIYKLSEVVDEFDLIVATGVLYAHYNYQPILETIRQHSNNIVLTCNIQSWEVPEVKVLGEQIFEMTFPYREYIQQLRIFKYVPTT